MQTTNITTTHALPAAAALVKHEVRDYDAWKAVFDGDADRRKASGIVGHHINRSADNPNALAVYFPATDLSKLQEFLADDTLKLKMKDAGVMGPPQVTLIRPREDMTNKERDLAGAVVIHSVADYDAWKAAFDAHGSARLEAGIVGHAVNVSQEDPNTVIVYLQAETVEALQAFASSESLKSAMQEAGVQGKPQIVFANGTDFTAY